MDTALLQNVHDLMRQGDLKPSRIMEGRFTARCPVPGHGKGRGDSNPSLSVVQNDTGVWFNCHAGCDHNDVVNALGLTNKALGHGNGSKRSTDVVYSYYSQENTLLFQVVRRPGKKFVQRRPDDNGGWIYNLKTITPVPYRLPELYRRFSDPVYIAEGEKDADTLNALGLLGTTAPMGAGKWRPAYNKYFANRTVYVLCDNDGPGLDHQRKVSEALCDIADCCYLCAPFPDAKDVTEWVSKNGYHKEDVVRWCEQGQALKRTRSHALPGGPKVEANAHGMALTDGGALMKKTIAPPVWTVPGLLCEGLCILAGKPKSGKSWMAMSIAMAISTGGSTLGLGECDAGRVLMIALEDSERRLQDRIRTISGHVDIPRTMRNLDMYVGPPPTLAQIGLWLAEHKGKARMVVVDTFGRWRKPQEKNTAMYDYDTRTADELQRMALKYHVSILLLHHTRKAEDPHDPLVDISGSYGLSGVADTLCVLRKKRGRPRAELFITGRDIDETVHKLRFQPSRDPGNPNAYAGWVITGGDDDDQPDLPSSRQNLYDVIKKHPEGIRTRDLVTETGLSRYSLADNLNKLIDFGLIDRADRGLYVATKHTTNNNDLLDAAQEP